MFNVDTQHLGTRRCCDVELASQQRHVPSVNTYKHVFRSDFFQLYTARRLVTAVSSVMSDTPTITNDRLKKGKTNNH